jgi:F5/8 type C domain
MDTNASPSDAGASVARPTEATKPGGFVEFFTRRRSLKAARAEVLRVVGMEAPRLGRASVFAELADRALDPVDPLRAGSGAGPALSLYRQAAYFALIGQDDALDAPDLTQAFERCPRDTLLFAAGGEAGLLEMRRVLVDKSYANDALEPDERVAEQARAARAFVYALLRAKLGAARQVARLQTQRWVRSSLLLAFVVSAALLIGWGARRVLTHPDLSAGKPWKASSQFVPCHPAEHRCGDAHTDIFFHTNEDHEPWVQIDLGQPQEFSRIEVVNRRDCCPDRAVPLVVEVSNDAQAWREVARQNTTFNTWDTRIAPTRARYVRARALRKTWLHLERVTARAK